MAEAVEVADQPAMTNLYALIERLQNDFNAKLASQETEIKSLKTLVASQETEIKSLKTLLTSQEDDFNAKLASQETEINSLKTQINSQEAKSAPQEIEINSLKSQEVEVKNALNSHSVRAVSMTKPVIVEVMDASEDNKIPQSWVDFCGSDGKRLPPPHPHPLRPF